MKKVGIIFLFSLFLLTGLLVACSGTKTYTVTFEKEGGILQSGKLTQRIKDGKSATAPILTKDGYALSWDKPFDKITEDTTVVAVWQAVAYTITYHLDDGTNGANPESYNVESDKIELLPARKTGQVFVGWFLDSDFIDRIDVIDVSSFGNLDLYARYATFDGGEGTQANPAVISSPQKLSLLASLVNDGNSFEGTYFDLASDINLGGDEWMPIGRIRQHTTPAAWDETCWFSGIFDGLGFSISNFKITATLSAAGLFGYNDGTIKNLQVQNFQIESGGGYVGGLVGHNHGDVQNCVVGLAGQESLATLKIVDNQAIIYLGGVVGYNLGGITDSYSHCTIDKNGSTSDFIGAVAGYDVNDDTNEAAD